jgi:DNA-binding transcriptional MerR regulator
MGLIDSVRQTFEKYRFYDAENTERIKQIMVLRKMQIPIKDIIRIYENQDMTVLVESFVTRINKIDHEIDALSELKRIVNTFMVAMRENGIKHISALPLMYETMSKKLETEETLDTREDMSYQKLSQLSEEVSAPLDLMVIDLPPMRVLSSKLKESNVSDLDGFWDWLGKSRIPFGTPGSHKLFEYQNDSSESVIIQSIERGFHNDSPYIDYDFEGGLFAVGSVYVDEDIASFHRLMIESFDRNPYYEVDYRHDGHLRHESLAESVISTDSMREKICLYLPVKRRLPNLEQYDPNEQVANISLTEIEQANPILKEYSAPLAEVTPINDPHYST